MRIKKKRNSRASSSDAKALSDLAEKLNSVMRLHSLSQSDIERATGVDQTVISRAATKHLKRVTPKTKTLTSYAIMQLKQTSLAVPAAVEQAVLNFLKAGGMESEILAFIQDATRILLRKQQ